MINQVPDASCKNCMYFQEIDYNGQYYEDVSIGRCQRNPVWVYVATIHVCGEHQDLLQYWISMARRGGKTDSAAIQPPPNEES